MTNVRNQDFELTEAGIWSLFVSRIEMRTGLGPVRRALIATLMVWLPLLVLSWIDHRSGAVADPVTSDIAVHVRCLVMIPVLVAGETAVAFFFPWILSQVRASGVLAAEDEPAYRRLLLRAAALRNSPWAVPAIVVLLMLPTLLVSLHLVDTDALLLKTGEERERARIGLAGQWYAFVVRPLVGILFAAWLWRTWAVAVYLCRGIARLPLRFSPTHPDGAGGLGFVADLPLIFVPFILALSSGVAADLAAAILKHDTTLKAMTFPIAGITVVLVLLAVIPLLLFVRPLRDMAYDAYDDYSALLVRYGQGVHARWIDRKPVDDDEGLLSASEIGPVADVNALFEAVDNIRPLQINRQMLIKLAVVALVPFVPVVLMTMPLEDLIGVLKDVVL